MGLTLIWASSYMNAFEFADYKKFFFERMEKIVENHGTERWKKLLTYIYFNVHIEKPILIQRI